MALDLFLSPTFKNKQPITTAHLARAAKMPETKISLLHTLEDFRQKKAAHPLKTIGLCAKDDELMERMTVKDVAPLRLKSFSNSSRKGSEKKRVIYLECSSSL